MTRTALAALGYPLIVFPLAYIWHLVLFGEKYAAFGYFSGEPNIAIGFLTIAMQGVILSLVYPYFRLGAAGFRRAFFFAGIMGAFFWTSHVLAFVAKQSVPQAGTYIVMETIFLSLQFGGFAVILGLLNRDSA